MRPRLILAAALAALGLAAPAGAATPACDKSCLLKLADRTVAAIAAKNPKSLPWAETVRFTENGVPLDIGDGLWGSTGSTPGRKATALADPASGNVVWIGTLYDHDQPNFGAIRLKADGNRIAEIELVIARRPSPTPYGDAASFTAPAGLTRPVPAATRASRERLVDVADAYLSTEQQNDGTLFAQFTPDCDVRQNGVSLSHDPAALAQGCEAQFKLGAYKPIARVRDRRFPVVDEAAGLVVAISMQDLPHTDTSFTTTDGQRREIKDQYPSSRTVLEVLRVEGGKVAGSEAVIVYQPYRMPSPWTR